MELRNERQWLGAKRQARSGRKATRPGSLVRSLDRVFRSSVINALPGVRENVRLLNGPIVMARSVSDIIARARRSGDQPVRNISARVFNFVINFLIFVCLIYASSKIRFYFRS